VGKTPNIIFADAPDLDEAASGAAEGIFYNSGQVCDAGSRLLVEESIHDRFLDAVKRHAAAYQPADPLDQSTKMGSMVDETQTKRVLGYIAKGKKKVLRWRSAGSRFGRTAAASISSPRSSTGSTIA
jgi:acyl-CoA reductase-like NAD-dependent aldehyde dehydrogenase